MTGILRLIRDKVSVAANKIRRYRVIFDFIDWSEEIREREFNKLFDRGKRLSDFAGMFVRLTFLITVGAIFHYKQIHTDGLTYVALAFCKWFTVIFTFGLNYYVLNIMLLFLWKDIPNDGPKAAKWSVFALSSIMTIGFMVGMSLVIYDFVQYNSFFQAITQPKDVG